MAEVYETLYPLERDFFNSLDSELAKVDQFFVARERDALHNVSALREQMRELKHHRKVFHVGTSPHEARLSNKRTLPGIQRRAKSTYKSRDDRRSCKVRTACEASAAEK